MRIAEPVVSKFWTHFWGESNLMPIYGSKFWGIFHDPPLGGSSQLVSG